MGGQRHIFATNFMVDDFEIYDRRDGEENYTNNQLTPAAGVAIARSHTSMQCKMN